MLSKISLAGLITVLLACTLGFTFMINPQLGNCANSPSSWIRTYGGAANDIAYSVVETTDGGYALAGYGYSNLLKTDADGSLQWSKSYELASAYTLVQTTDNGYALAGTKTVFTLEDQAWLIRADSMGNMLENRGWGGPKSFRFYALVQTSDGGFALAGFTESSGAGLSDAWLVRTDSNGNELWSKTYGGTSDDWAYALVQTSDGGFALAGFTESSGAGLSDAWLVRTDSNGNELWSKTYGGSHRDEAYSLVQTSDGGYALAGYTGSFGTGGDFWLVKTDASGTTQWKETYGGELWDEAHALVQTNDGGYALAGGTRVSGAGNWDALLVRTDSGGNMLWSKTYGGTSDDWAYALVQTNDDGFAFTGYTKSSGAGEMDFWLVKTDSNGEVPSTFPWLLPAIILTVVLIVVILVVIIKVRYSKRRIRKEEPNAKPEKGRNFFDG